MNAIELLGYIRQIPHDLISERATQESWLEGVRIARTQQVATWSWEDPRAEVAILHVRLHSKNPITIILSCFDHELKAMCICSQTHVQNELFCAHVIGVILTIHTLYTRLEYAETSIALVEELCEPIIREHKDTLQGVTALIYPSEFHENDFSVEFSRGRTTVHAGDDMGQDPLLGLIIERNLLSSASYRLAWFLWRMVLLCNGTLSVPGKYGQPMHVTLDNEMSIDARVELTLMDDGKIRVAQRVAHDGQILHLPLARIGSTYAIFTEEMRLVRVSDGFIWGWADRLWEIKYGTKFLRETILMGKLHPTDAKMQRILRDEHVFAGLQDPFIIHQDSMNNCSPLYYVKEDAPIIRRSIRIISVDRHISIESAEMNVQVYCVSDPSKSRIKCTIKCFARSCEIAILHSLMEFMGQSNTLPMWVQSQARKNSLLRSCIELLYTPRTKLKKQIKSALETIA